MTLDDTIYSLGARVGWSRCDYARNQDEEIYGLTDGRVTLALTPMGEEIYWETSVSTEDGADPLGSGVVRGKDELALLEAWLLAVRPAVDRATATVSRLTEEGWGVQYSEEGIVLHRGGAWVTITDDGEVISMDPMARLYVHCIYYPEVYAPAPSSASR